MSCRVFGTPLLLRKSMAKIFWVRSSSPKFLMAAATAAGVGVGVVPSRARSSRFCFLDGVPPCEAFEALEGDGEGGANARLAPMMGFEAILMMADWTGSAQGSRVWERAELCCSGRKNCDRASSRGEMKRQFPACSSERRDSYGFASLLCGVCCCCCCPEGPPRDAQTRTMEWKK